MADVAISAYVDYVYLTRKERDAILNAENEYLFEQIAANDDRNAQNDDITPSLYWTMLNDRWTLVAHDRQNNRNESAVAAEIRRQREREQRERENRR